MANGSSKSELDRIMLVQKERLAKGAEATIYRGTFLNLDVILKQRFPKDYRLPQIDQSIRISRLRSEARISTFAWKIGVRVPALLGIDANNMTLILEELKGVTLFSILPSFSLKSLKTVFNSIGQQVGLLHNNNIVHGDLTVFNIIMNKEVPWLIDFGLSQISVEIENKADDLLTFYNTLKAVFTQYQVLFNVFLKGYLKVNEEGRKTFEHMKKIQSRARYIARENRLE